VNLDFFMPSPVALTLAVGAVPVSAEIRVSYDAQAKAVKKGIPLGDPLGFSL